jgi:hypothetical protein
MPQPIPKTNPPSPHPHLSGMMPQPTYRESQPFPTPSAPFRNDAPTNLSRKSTVPYPIRTSQETMTDPMPLEELGLLSAVATGARPWKVSGQPASVSFDEPMGAAWVGYRLPLLDSRTLFVASQQGRASMRCAFLPALQAPQQIFKGEDIGGGGGYRANLCTGCLYSACV